MKRKATAVWKGDLKAGKGNLTTESGVLNATPYSFSTRFEGEKGTNPEELIGAAHAGCFTMALSGRLTKAGFTATELRTEAQVSLEQKDGGWGVENIHLNLHAHVPGVTQDQFKALAEDAKANCPISKVIRAEIRLTYELTN